MKDNIKKWRTEMSSKTVVPKYVILETVFGCNANCVMCPINKPTKRKKGIISSDLFKHIIDELAPYKEKISQMDLFGVGEPLLDKDFPNKVKYAKKKGFQDVGFATNAHLLEIGLAHKLFKAGVDTIMISIDGITKEVHESIRINTNFYRIVANVKQALILRDKQNYKTKFVLRFIRQPKNRHQWPGFCQYWTPLISEKKGDLIIGYDMHSWGGEIDVPGQEDKESVPADIPCHHLFDRMMILCDGTIVLCCADMHQANYSLGNVKDSPLIEIYNCQKIQEIREKHLSGHRLDMKICADCTILKSELTKEIKND